MRRVRTERQDMPTTLNRTMLGGNPSTATEAMNCDSPQSGFMRKAVLVALLALVSAGKGRAQAALTWSELRAKFEATNPTLIAGRIGIDESKAAEITAYLRPNPNVTGDARSDRSVHKPTPAQRIRPEFLQPFPIRVAIRRRSTIFTNGSTSANCEGTAPNKRPRSQTRNSPTRREIFYSICEARSYKPCSRRRSWHWPRKTSPTTDQVLKVSRDRRQLGDISHGRSRSPRNPTCSVRNRPGDSEVNLRTAKIQLLTLLNDRTPIERFDVAGPYESPDQILGLGGVSQDRAWMPGRI